MRMRKCDVLGCEETVEEVGTTPKGWREVRWREYVKSPLADGPELPQHERLIDVCPEHPLPGYDQ